MFETVKNALCKLLRIPPEPTDPMGDVASLLVFRASVNYYRYKLLAWLLKSLAGLLLAIAVSAFIAFQIASAKPARGGLDFVSVLEMTLLAFLLVAGALFKAAASFFLVRLDYEMRWYKLSDRSLRIREGLATVKEMTMTFANIQNISIDQGPLQRLFGIADLKVDSAGGGGALQAAKAAGQQDSSSAPHVAYFRGVDNPEEILAIMRQRLKHCQDAGLGHPEDEQAAVQAPPAPAAASPERLELYKGMLIEARGLRAALERAAAC